MSTYCVSVDLGSDFTLPDNMVNFQTGAGNGASDCVSISIIDDGDFEGDHSFTVGVMSFNPQTNIANPGLGVVTIQDNQGTYLCV